MAGKAGDLKKGNFIVIDRDPYVVLALSHSHIGRGGAVFQTKIRSLKTGGIVQRNFKPGDSVEEAEISKTQAKFLYEKRGQYWFHELGNPSNRFFIPVEALGEKALFLKSEMEAVALKFRDEVINVDLPIKADYKVIQAPPNIRGNTADGGRKSVTIETGAKVNVPLFIEEGDTIRINIETGEYAERV